MYTALIQQNPGLSKLLESVGRISQYLWVKGWAERNAGNISVRLGDDFRFDRPAKPVQFPLPLPFSGLGGEVFFMTGTGKRMRDIHHDPLANTLVLQISDDGTSWFCLSHDPAAPGSPRPTSELSSHLSIHLYLSQHQPLMNSVVHAHPGEVIALTHLPGLRDEAMLNRILWSMHPESVVFLQRGVGLVPYALTGSNALGLASIEALEGHEVVVWEKHGCLAVGDTPETAFDLIDILCKSAGIYLTCRSAGFEPEGLTDGQMDELRKSFH